MSDLRRTSGVRRAYQPSSSISSGRHVFGIAELERGLVETLCPTSQVERDALDMTGAVAAELLAGNDSDPVELAVVVAPGGTHVVSRGKDPSRAQVCVCQSISGLDAAVRAAQQHATKPARS